MTAQYTLYGAPLSLYTGKARAYLKFKNQPFEEVFCSMKIYKEVIIPNTGVRFIPVVKTPQGEYLQDTTHIIEHMEAVHTERSVVPPAAKQKLVSMLFETWADEWLLIPAMHYRWNKANFPFIYQEFGKVIAPNMPGFIRAFIGKRIGAKFKGFVPVLGITPKSIPAIEDWYEGHVLRLLDAHFAQYDYLLGGKPCVGDFGLMGPLYAHLYRDPAPGAIMAKLAPNLVRWIERMNQAQLEEGQWLANDQIPASLHELLQNMFKQQWPVLTSTVQLLEQWALQHPQQPIPRMIGEHQFTIGQCTENRVVAPFHQWKMQRLLDCYQQITGDNKTELDAFLRQVHGFVPLQQKIRMPVVRVNNKLQFA
jgi:glutathione S-transferase